MRRYQSLGLLRNRQLRTGHRNLGRQEGVERFVSSSQTKDVLLYRRLAKLRPGLNSLQFANDDVDWQLEYFCDAIGKWIMKALGWILWLFQAISRCLLPQCLRRVARGVPDADERGDKDDDNDDDTRQIKRITQMSYDVVGRRQWRYDQCRPFLKRRIIKRKWFLKPETRKWATETVDLYHRHVNRGFRLLCSRIGKDSRICVYEGDNESPPESRNVFVFFGDQRTLSAQSDLFKLWYKYNGDKKEIRTSLVKPDEMEGILLYIYTLTWPINLMVADESCSQGKCKRKSIDPAFLDALEMYGISLKLNRENPYQRPNSELTPLQVLANYADSEEDILYDSFLHPNLQYIFSPSESGFEGRGDCYFVSEVSNIRNVRKRRRTNRKSVNKAHSIVTPPKQSSPSTVAEDNSNVNRSFLRLLSNPFLRRIHPESISTIDRGGISKNDDDDDDLFELCSDSPVNIR